MRYLELRRHSWRDKPNEHLSQKGVDVARRLGASCGPFALVVTSTTARAIETAVAMGFAVDHEDERIATMAEDVDDSLPYPFDFRQASQVYRQGAPAQRFADAQALVLKSIVERASDGSTVLVVGHGGVIELGAIGCLPQADHAAWGATVERCEGVRLAYDGGKFVSADILRLAGELNEAGA